MPTATSDAATVRTMMARMMPPIGPASGRSGPYRQNATRLILAAFSMISIAISTAIGLRRTSTPARPIANDAAAKYKNQVSGISSVITMALFGSTRRHGMNDANQG